MGTQDSNQRPIAPCQPFPNDCGGTTFAFFRAQKLCKFLGVLLRVASVAVVYRGVGSQQTTLGNGPYARSKRYLL